MKFHRIKLSYEEALHKARRFCAYQERAPQEVMRKLETFGLHTKEKTALIEELEDEGYLNEERFADGYSRGKFNQKGWGRLKIHQALREKGVSQAVIARALAELPEQGYREKLLTIARKKREQLKDEGAQLKPKLARYLASKGYESGLVWSVVDQVIAEHQD